ncbi:MAG: hypothetical protein AMXMBFR83_18940 [Phycisphaerae bacterium]
MRCRQCEYRLWALRTRECPECGRPFAPSEYEFVPGSVRFACPHCDQSYYGTAANGHLVPTEFDCVSCGRHVHMDEMVLFPAEGIEEERTRLEAMPWLDRKNRGFVRAWFRTLGMALVAPGRLMVLTPAGRSVGQAWWFAVVTQLIFSLTAGLTVMILPLLLVAGLGRGGGPGPMSVLTGTFGGMCLGWWASILVGVALWGLIAHGFLYLTGGARNGIGRTYQALCYSSGANVLAGLPCVGIHLFLFGIAPIWWVVSAILMLREGQKVHAFRAATAVLILPLLVVAGEAVFFAVVVKKSMAVAATAATRAATLTTQTAPTQTVLDAMMQYARDHDQQWPPHAVELIDQEYLLPAQVVDWRSPQRGPAVPVAGTTLSVFDLGTRQERQDARERARKSLPPRVSAHRLGDYVFTYHGVPPRDADARLWLLIGSPDPAGPTPASPPAHVTVGQADGTVLDFPVDELPGRLEDQNSLRARYGLPALPPPGSVTHTRPASAPATAPASSAGA